MATLASLKGALPKGIEENGLTPGVASARVSGAEDAVVVVARLSLRREIKDVESEDMTLEYGIDAIEVLAGGARDQGSAMLREASVERTGFVPFTGLEKS